MRSGDNVGQEPVFDLGDLILEGELLLLQAPDRQLIGRACDLEGEDLVIQQSVLGAELNQLIAKLPVVLPLHVAARQVWPARALEVKFSGGRAGLSSHLLQRASNTRGLRNKHPEKTDAYRRVESAGRFNETFVTTALGLDRSWQICNNGSVFSFEKEVRMALSAHLQELSEKHRQLERRIEEETLRPGSDDLAIRRLKQEKLKLKDEIQRLEVTRH
jgi:hypothetical protein